MDEHSFVELSRKHARESQSCEPAHVLALCARQHGERRDLACEIAAGALESVQLDLSLEHLDVGDHQTVAEFEKALIDEIIARVTPIVGAAVEQFTAVTDQSRRERMRKLARLWKNTYRQRSPSPEPWVCSPEEVAY